MSTLRWSEAWACHNRRSLDQLARQALTLLSFELLAPAPPPTAAWPQALLLLASLHNPPQQPLPHSHFFTSAFLSPFPLVSEHSPAWTWCNYPCWILRLKKPFCYATYSWPPSTGMRNKLYNTWKTSGDRLIRSPTTAEMPERGARPRPGGRSRGSEGHCQTGPREEKAHLQRLQGRHTPSQHHRLSSVTVHTSEYRGGQICRALVFHQRWLFQGHEASALAGWWCLQAPNVLTLRPVVSVKASKFAKADHQLLFTEIL